MINCHAGCAPEHIVASLGLTLKDLFVDVAPKPARTTAKRIVATYDYTGADGTLIYQVVRYEPKSFAQRRPDGAGGWAWNLTGVTRVLYNWPAVEAAITVGRKVFLVEGEKDAETLRDLGLTATTNAGGAAKWDTRYSEILNRGTVIILPDNDGPGRTHARIVADQLADCIVIELPGLPPKGDVTDWVNAGGTRQDLIALTRAALEERDQTPAAPATPAPSQPRLFKPLGYNHGLFYLLPSRSMQVAAYSAPALGMKPNLFAVAPLAYWESQAEYMGDNGPRWSVITSDLLQSCYDAGIFRDEYRRGRGAWWDNGRIILHLGDKLIVEGEPCGLLDINSGYTYERGKSIAYPLKGGLTSDQAGRLSDLLQLLSWETPIAGTLLAGWLACAPICGVLKWRPHLWLTGPSGSGKSWTLENIIRPILRDIAVNLKASTSEAGARQILHCDALPVQFDEIETDDEKGQREIQKILELARQSSSEDKAIIAKGTTTGQAMLFDIQSMFLMASVSVGLKRRADETRVTVLALRKQSPGQASVDQFERIKQAAASVCTGEFAGGLIARSCKLAKVIRRNAETFALAVTQTLSSRRTGDQLGTLLAGAWSLWSDDEITLDRAIEYVHGLPLRDVLPVDDSQDESRCLSYLLERRVRFDHEGHADRTIGELVELAINPTSPAVGAAADATLKRYGLRADNPVGLILSTNHSAIGEMLQNTPWATGWSVFLRRLDGAEACGKNIRFAGGSPSKAIQIPWETVFDEDGEDGMPVQTELQEEVPF